MRIDFLAKRKTKRHIATIAVLQFVFSLLLPLGTTAVTQNGYRWRNDNGSETTATNNAAENTSLSTASIGVNQRLRFGAANNGTESELLRQASIRLNLGFDQYLASVIDTAAGFVYFATNTAPIRIVKVRLSDFTKVAHIDLPAGDDFVASNSGVLDAANGFAYFAASTKPAKIIKIRLSDFTHVGSITLASGEESPRSGGIDASGFLYYALTAASSTPSKVVKINLATFTPVATLTFAAGESGATSLVIDPANGFVYVSLSATASRIVKVRLSDFTEVAIFTTTGVRIQTGGIDAANGKAYFTTNEFPGKIIKIDLPTFTQDGSLTLASGDDSPVCTALDLSAGIGYFCVSSTTSPRLVKVNLASLTQAGSLVLPTGESPRQSVIDSANARLYTGTSSSPGKILRINLTTFTKVDDITLETGENISRAGIMDKGNGFIYFALTGNPGKIVKVRLSDFTKVATLTLSSGNDDIRKAVIDTSTGFAYFGTGTIPARIIKVDLSTFTEAATLTLVSGENTVLAAIIDTSSPTHYAYFMTSATPGKVVKVDLSTFTEVATMTFSSGFSGSDAAIDTAGGFAYFARTGNPGSLTKVRLSDFTELQSVSFASGENNGLTIDLDTANGFGYIGTNTFPGKIVKIRLSDMVYIGSLTLGTGEDSPGDSTIDEVNGFVYYSTGSNPMIIAKISTATFTEAAALTYSSPENSGRGMVIDAQTGHFYIGSGTSPAYLIKTSIAPKSQFRLEYGLKTSTCAAISTWTQVLSVAGPTDAWQMSDSGHITDGSASTNNAGLTDGNTSFNPGIIKDTSSQTAEISLGEKQFTEVEYSVKPVNDSTIGSNYCFRLTNAGSTTGFVYTQYAEATVTPRPPSGSGGCSFVIRPNGGEYLSAGQSYEIQWSHSSCQSQAARISLSTDGGGTYPTIIAANEPEDGTYTWTVPDINTTSAKVKVELLMGGVVQGADASDGDFSITGTSGAPSTLPPTTPLPSGQSENYDANAESMAATSIDADQGWESAAGPHPCIEGTALKGVSSKAVYYCGSDGKRHVFPNEKTFKTWFSDFSHVMTFSDATVAAIPEGKTITYKPGVKMIKVTSDPKTYAVAAGGVRRWVETETAAIRLYGAFWNMKIDDLLESLFDDYTAGESIK